MPKAWQKVDTSMVAYAVHLGQQLNEIELMVRRMPAAGEDHNLGIVLSNIKRALNKAVRQVDMMQYTLENPNPGADDEG